MLHLNTILVFQFSVKYVTLPCCSSSDPLQSLYFACKHPACYLQWSHCVTGVPQETWSLFVRGRGGAGSAHAAWTSMSGSQASELLTQQVRDWHWKSYCSTFWKVPVHSTVLTPAHHSHILFLLYCYPQSGISYIWSIQSTAFYHLPPCDLLPFPDSECQSLTWLWNGSCVPPGSGHSVSHLWNTISTIISPSGIYWSGAELLKTSREATHIPTFPWLAGIRWATQDNQIISNHCNSFAKSAGSLFSCIYFHATGKLNPKHTLENLHSPSLLVIFILTSLSTVLSKMTACAVI